MSRIRFRADQIFESIGPNKGPRFPAGFVLDEQDVGDALRVRQEPAHAASFIDRWVNLDLADLVDDDVPASDPKSIVVVGGKPVAVFVTDDAQPDDGPTSEDDGKDLTKLSREQLDALAAERGVDIAGAKNKGDVIAALELAAEQSQQ